VSKVYQLFETYLIKVEPVAPKTAAKKKFASKMRSIVSAVKTAQLLEVI